MMICQARQWSVVTYQLDNILPKNVCSCHQDASISFQPHETLEETPDNSTPQDERNTNSIQHPSSFSTGNNTNAYQDFFINDKRGAPFPPTWKHLVDRKKAGWIVGDSENHDRVCNNCQMLICSNCGNPFSDEECSSSYCDQSLVQGYSNLSDNESQGWNQWPFYNPYQENWSTSHLSMRNMKHDHLQQQKKKKKTIKRSGESSLTIDDLSKYFDLPRKEAAKRLGLCVTLLKRRCRELGIHCWPFRKMRCLDDRIKHLESRKGQSDSNGDDIIDKQIRTLEQRRISLLKNPNINLQQLFGSEDDI